MRSPPRCARNHPLNAVLLAVLWAGCLVRGETPQAPLRRTDEVRERLEELRAAAAVRSTDRHTVVFGAALSTPDKLTLVRFLEETRERAARLLGADFNGPDCALSLRAVKGEPDAPCRLQVSVSAEDVPPIRMVAIAPQLLQPENLAAEVCVALLRADALAHGYRDPAEGGPGAERPAPYPRWFGAGVARLLDPAGRQEDAERVLAQWAVAGLPDVHVLANAVSPYASADPAVAAQLVAWLLDGQVRSARFAALRLALVRGTPWSSDLLVEVAGCAPDPGAADARWDLWLLARRWTVLTPGATTAGLIERTRDQLLVRPALLGPYLATFASLDAMEPADLLGHRNAAWLPLAASSRIGLLQRMGAGRDNAYRAMVDAYTAFFNGLLRGDSNRNLERLLRKADARLEELEKQVYP